MLAIFLFTAFLVIRTAPDTFLGRVLHRALVEWPAEKLSRLTRGQAVCWLGFGLALWAAVAVLGGDAVRMVGMALPETAAWFAAFDVSMLADILVAAALVATQTRVSGMRARLQSALTRAGRRSPRPRAPRRRRTIGPKPDNDEEPAPRFALAA